MANPSIAIKQKISFVGFRFSSFFIRLMIICIIMGALMIASNVNIGAIGQGFALSLLGVGVFITFRILSFPDLSVDASFAIGGAVTATLIATYGWNAEWTLFGAFIIGALVGLSTALIHVLFKIEGLLASIIVMTGTYTVVLRIMGTSNIPLLNSRTILTPYQEPMRTFLVENFGNDMRRQSNNLVEIIVFSVVVMVVMFILNWFMKTEIGLTIRAVGRNRQMIRALGVNDQIMVILALMISNGLTGIAGAFSVQQIGFADVNMGIGMIVRGLASVMIGEVLLRPKSIGQSIFSAMFGMIVFEISRAWVFSALDLPASDVRMVSALVVLLALATPYLMAQYRTWRKRQQVSQE